MSLSYLKFTNTAPLSKPGSAFPLIVTLLKSLPCIKSPMFLLISASEHLLPFPVLTTNILLFSNNTSLLQGALPDFHQTGVDIGTPLTSKGSPLWLSSLHFTYECSTLFHVSISCNSYTLYWEAHFLLCVLLYPQHLAQWLMHSRPSVRTFEQMSEWMAVILWPRKAINPLHVFYLLIVLFLPLFTCVHLGSFLGSPALCFQVASGTKTFKKKV